MIAAPALIIFILERKSPYTISKLWLLLLLPIIMVAEGLK